MKFKAQEIPILESAKELSTNAETLNITETIYHPSYLVGLIHNPDIWQYTDDDVLKKDFKEIFQLLHHGNLKLIQNGKDFSFLKLEKNIPETKDDFNLPYYNLNNVNLYVLANQKNELLQSVTRKLCKKIKLKKLTNKPLVKVFFSEKEAEDYLRSLIGYDFYNHTNRPLKIVNINLETAYCLWQNCSSQMALIPSSSGLGKTVYFSDQTLTLPNGKTINLVSFQKDNLIKTLTSFGKSNCNIEAKNFNDFLTESKNKTKNYFFLPISDNPVIDEKTVFSPEKKFSPLTRFRNILLVNPLAYHTKNQIITKEKNLPSSFAAEEYEKLLKKEKTRNRKRKKRLWRRNLYRKYRWAFQKLYYWSMEETTKTAVNSKNKLVQQLLNRTRWRHYDLYDMKNGWFKRKKRAIKIIKFDPIRERKNFFFKRPSTLIEYFSQQVIWDRKDRQVPITKFAPLNWRMRSLFTSPDAKNAACNTSQIAEIEKFVLELNQEKPKLVNETLKTRSLSEISKNTKVLKK